MYTPETYRYQKISISQFRPGTAFRPKITWLVTYMNYFPYSLILYILTYLNRFKPSSKIFLLTVPMRIICFLCLVFLRLLHLFIAACWSPTGKGLTSCLLLVMYIVFLLLSHVVFWVRCGNWLYRFLIFASFLTFWMYLVCLVLHLVIRLHII